MPFTVFCRVVADEENRAIDDTAKLHNVPDECDATDLMHLIRTNDDCLAFLGSRTRRFSLWRDEAATASRLSGLTAVRTPGDASNTTSVFVKLLGESRARPRPSCSTLRACPAGLPLAPPHPPRPASPRLAPPSLPIPALPWHVPITPTPPAGLPGAAAAGGGGASGDATVASQLSELGKKLSELAKSNSELAKASRKQ